MAISAVLREWAHSSVQSETKHQRVSMASMASFQLTTHTLTPWSSRSITSTWRFIPCNASTISSLVQVGIPLPHSPSGSNISFRSILCLLCRHPHSTSLSTSASSSCSADWAGLRRLSILITRFAWAESYSGKIPAFTQQLWWTSGLTWDQAISVRHIASSWLMS